MTTIAQGTQLMKSALEKHCNGGAWHNQCGRFVCRFVTGADATGAGLGASRDTAWEAHLGSGPVIYMRHRNAPPGAIGWYRKVGDEPNLNDSEAPLHSSRLCDSTPSAYTPCRRQPPCWSTTRFR